MVFTKKICRSIACLLMVLMCVSSFGIQARAEYSDVEAAQNSVVRVFVPIPDGGYSIGSGFAVGKEGEPVSIIVTNHHVVENDVRNVYVTTTDIDGGIPAEVLYKDAKNDFAILELKESLNDRVPIVLLSPKEVHKSQDVYAIGFPGLSDTGSASNALDSSIDAMTITKGTVSNPQYDYDGTTCVMSDVKLNGGNSGGPMVDEKGQAIGINTMVIGLNQVNNMSLAVSIDYVTEVLDDLDIEYITGGDASKQDKDDKKDKDDQKDDEEEDNSTIILVGGIAAAVILAVAVVAMTRRPAKSSGKRSSSDDGTETVKMGSFEVVCQRGPLQGKRIVSSGMVRIGRNPTSCQMVFPDGTPGISKLHCEIQIYNGVITLQDLNSSYGTFLANGERILGRRELHGESILLLGSDKVIISVKKIS